MEAQQAPQTVPSPASPAAGSAADVRLPGGTYPAVQPRRRSVDPKAPHAVDAWPRMLHRASIDAIDAIDGVQSTAEVLRTAGAVLLLASRCGHVAIQKRLRDAIARLESVQANASLVELETVRLRGALSFLV